MTTLECIPQSPDLDKASAGAGAFSMAAVLTYTPAEPYDSSQCPPMDEMEHHGSRREELFDVDELIRRLEAHRQELRMVQVRQKTEALKSKRASVASSYQPRYSRRQTKVVDPDEANAAMAAYSKVDFGRPSLDSAIRRSTSISNGDSTATRPLYASREDLAAEYHRDSPNSDDRHRKRLNRRSLAIFGTTSTSHHSCSKSSSRPASSHMDAITVGGVTSDRLGLYAPRPVTAQLRAQNPANFTNTVYWPSLSIKEREQLQEKEKEERETKALRRRTWVSPMAPPAATTRHSLHVDDAEASLRLIDGGEDKENHRPATSAGPWLSQSHHALKRPTHSGRNSDATGDAAGPVKKALKESGKTMRRVKSLFGLFKRRSKD